jgi:hypothetical protein
MTLPISSPAIASNFSRGGGGEDSIAPVSPGAACNTPTGTVTSTRGACSKIVFASDTASMATFPVLQAILRATVLVRTRTPALATRSMMNFSSGA